MSASRSAPDRPDDATAAREAAVRLLAGREHSRAELQRKLARRGWSAPAVEQALDWLAEHGLQSDARYAEAYARERAEKHYGPARIRAELAERGVDRALIAAALDGLETDFTASARDFHDRKYRKAAADYPERARRAQALSRRGFAAEHLRWLLDGE